MSVISSQWKGSNERLHCTIKLRYRLFYFSWLGLDLVLSVAWSFEFQLVVFFCFGISVVLVDTLGISRPRGYKTFTCSAQLSMTFSLLINMKMPTNVGIFIFISTENLTLS